MEKQNTIMQLLLMITHSTLHVKQGNDIWHKKALFLCGLNIDLGSSLHMLRTQTAEKS